MSNYFESINDWGNIVISDNDSRSKLTLSRRLPLLYMNTTFNSIAEMGSSYEKVGTYQRENPLESKYRVDYVLSIGLTVNSFERLVCFKPTVVDDYIGYCLLATQTDNVYTMYIALGVNRTHFTSISTDNDLYEILRSIDICTFGEINDIAQVQYATDRYGSYTYWNPKSETYGLEVRNASGGYVFHSSSRYANILKAFHYSQSFNARDGSSLWDFVCYVDNDTIETGISRDNIIASNSVIKFCSTRDWGSGTTSIKEFRPSAFFIVLGAGGYYARLFKGAFIIIFSYGFSIIDTFSWYKNDIFPKGVSTYMDILAISSSGLSR